MLKKILAIILFMASALGSQAADWINLPAKENTHNGKKIVFVTGDDEYKSETSMPMMAHILAEHHGFDCRVLFAINRKTGVIDTNQRDNIPGLEALADADLMVIYTRFRALEDAQMKMIEDYLATGKPIIAFRTSTHAFDFSKNPKSPYAKYAYNYKGEDFKGGFGEQILGQTWIRHWGRHGKQSARGRFAPGQEKHPVLTGIKDGEIWGPTDVYEATLPMIGGCLPVLLGEVCATMEPNSGPALAPPAGAKGRNAINKNDPMMPIAWTYQRPVGAKGRVFTSTIGGAMKGKDDWANAGVRRMFVNACFWTLKMEAQIPAKAEVTPVLNPNPFRRGVKPAETLAAALGKKTKTTKTTKITKPTKIEKKGNTILFYGNSMVERLLENGELEARLQIANPSSALKIRSFAWTGDEVGNRLRLEGYAKHMKKLIAEWPAQSLVLGYGFYESFAGAEGLAEFEAQYRTHLDQLKHAHPGAKLVLLSPIASEDTAADRNADLELYTKAIQKLAGEAGGQFIDLFSTTKQAYAATEAKLTDNGIHLNQAGNKIAAKVIADALSGPAEIDPQHLQEVTLAASAKHQRVAEIVRPKNAVVYFGVRARPDEYNGEMPRYHEMIRLTEAIVHDLAANPGKKFSEVTSPGLPPMAEGKSRKARKGHGVIKPVSKAISEFKVHDDYELSLFASEEEFPELRNPVQIAFDAKGRLWVVTMPSFPHTVPGLTPSDKILILEDTDHDGKADKVTTYMEGLDALDGIAFHRKGVIISEQPRLWLTNDTDGNDRLNSQSELLRGIDVTDSHHGGMIAADPMGDVIFSDGVFHRSQLETPHGVHRGMDATTYSLNLDTQKIATMWQHTTPNPWKVTFDRWGNTYQNYGDGALYDGTALPWTPFGSYHPYKYAFVCGYGKGSGAAIVSSPNFPDAYDQGVVTASLLGRYAVTLTGFNYDDGMVKSKDPVTLLSSPNAAFRPADVEFGMDGALYVSDFCSPIIGHAQHPMRDPGWDHDYGRIWKIVHKKKPLVKTFPAILGAPVGDLCRLLTHRQDLVRNHARIELRKHGVDGAKAVDQWINAFDRNDENFAQAALEANFVLGGLGEVRPALLSELAKSKSFHHRVAVTHLIVKQAAQLEDRVARLSALAQDSHPRVLVAVINAVSQIRPIYPEVDQVLALITSGQKMVKQTLKILDRGLEPAKGRSVPVLDVAPAARLTHWYQYQPGGKGKAVLHTAKKPAKGTVNLYRTFVESEVAQSAILGINYKTLDVIVNGALVFSQNSLWSGDQQIQVKLVPGLNVIEVELTKPPRRGGKGLPPVYLYDAVGNQLSKVTYVNDSEDLKALSEQHKTLVKKQGSLLRIQAAPGLQFAPTKLTVEAGSQVRLLFQNPDIMQHNFLLLAPGSVAEIGALADKMASQPDAIAKHYVPESPKVLVSSKLVAPQGEEELTFQAPIKPGNYPYLCTFPGHWQIMKGVLTVTAKKPKK